ncbi:DnaJ domain-containing protein, partial [Dimargaris cristalligena]
MASHHERIHRLLAEADHDDQSSDNEEPPSLYVILELDEKATGDQIKHAYRKMAIRFHPDKLSQQHPTQTTASSNNKTNSNDPEDEEALRIQWTERFQKITLAYSILSDEAKRRRYDRTGSTEDSALLDDIIEEGRDWDAYFTDLYTDLVNASTIAQFSAQYRDSAEERADVLAAYRQCEGDMDLILNTVLLATV